MDSTTVNRIIRWEQGDLPEEETVELFKTLVETGDAWSLQGFYGRQAMRFIQAGLIERPSDERLPPMVRHILSEDFCGS